MHGIRGRRVGTQPYCPRCGYNLTGLNSSTCPECGLSDIHRQAVRGKRRSNRLAIVGGSVLMLGLMPPLGFDIYRRATGFNYRPYLPLSWVLYNADNGDIKYLNELVRRDGLNEIDNAGLQRVAKIALQKQKTVRTTTDAQIWINLLEAIQQRGLLTPEQSAQYYSQMLNLSFEVRPRIRSGESLSFRLREFSAAPTTKRRTIRDEKLGHGYDDEWPKAIGYFSGRSSVSGVGSSGWSGSSISLPELEPGTHTARLKVRYTIYDGPFWENGVEQSPPEVWTDDLEFSAPFEVLPADAPDTVQLINDPNLAAAIQSAIQMEDLRTSPSHSHQGTLNVQLSVRFSSQPGTSAERPADVAFSVYLQTATGVQELGSVTANTTTTNGSTHVQQDDIQPFEEETATIILKTDPDAARNTIDLFEIWDGELIFNAVPIEHREP